MEKLQAKEFKFSELIGFLLRNLSNSSLCRWDAICDIQRFAQWVEQCEEEDEHFIGLDCQLGIRENGTQRRAKIEDVVAEVKSFGEYDSAKFFEIRYEKKSNRFYVSEYKK